MVSVSIFRQLIMLPFLAGYGDLIFQKIAWTILVTDVLLTSACNSLGDYFYKIESNDENIIYDSFLSDFTWLGFLAVITATILLSGVAELTVLLFLELLIFTFLASSNLMLCKIKFLRKNTSYYIISSLCRIISFSIFCVYFYFYSDVYPVLFFLLSLIFGELLLAFFLGGFIYRLFFKVKSFKSEPYIFSLMLLLVVLIQKSELVAAKTIFPENFSLAFIGVTLTMLFLMPLNMLFSVPAATLLSRVGGDIDKLWLVVDRLFVVAVIGSFFIAVSGFILYEYFFDFLYSEIPTFLSNIEAGIFIFISGVGLLSSRLILKVASLNRCLAYLALTSVMLILSLSISYKSLAGMLLATVSIKAFFLVIFLYLERSRYKNKFEQLC